MKVVVTGGAGFIGSDLVDKLLEQGHDVTVIDNFSSGKDENLSQHKNNPHLTVHKKDINDNLTEDLKGAEVVFHLAAIPLVQFSIQHPKETHHNNVTGTLH